MTRRLGVLTLAVLAACHAQISLGDPDAAAGFAVDGSPVAPAQCASPSGVRSIATYGQALGEPRAIAADARFVYVAFALGDGAGRLARMPAEGGALEVLATLGTNPARMVLDDAYVYVTCPGSSEVQRVDKESGARVTVPDQSGAQAIAVGTHGRAYWTLPAQNRIVSSDFSSAAPSDVASKAGPVDLAVAGDLLFIEGTGSIDVIDLTGTRVAQRLADGCGSGQIGVDATSVYCAEGDRIVRVERASGQRTVVAVGQRPLDGVLVAGGRVLWRSVYGTRAYLSGAPLDGIGGPTLLDPIDDVHAPWAGGRCDVLWASGKTIFARGI